MKALLLLATLLVLAGCSTYERDRMRLYDEMGWPRPGSATADIMAMQSRAYDEVLSRPRTTRRQTTPRFTSVAQCLKLLTLDPDAEMQQLCQDEMQRH